MGRTTGTLPLAQGPSAPTSSSCPNHRALWETLVRLQELLTLDIPGLKSNFKERYLGSIISMLLANNPRP